MNEPQSLAEMQQMEREDFEQVGRYKWQGELSSKRVIRHLIELADREVSWQGRENASSLREFWYNPVKTIVESAFPDKMAEWGDNKFNRRMSQYLSSVLSDLVKDPTTGISYRSLNILDDSRDRQIRSTAIEGDKILFVEKDSAYRHLKPLAEVYQISVVSGSGFEATALIEDIAHELSDDKEYTLLIVSDYDPNGFEIARDFKDRAIILGIPVKEVKRIGINPEQVADELVQEQRFPVPASTDRAKEWMREYGLEGRYGLEIEAVSPDMENRGLELRRVISAEMEDLIDEEERYRKYGEQKIGYIHNNPVDVIVSDLTEELKKALWELALEISEVDEIDGIEVEVEDILGVNASVDSLNTILDNDNEFLPPVPKFGELHERAVDVKTDLSGEAQPPRPSTARQRRKMKEKIRKAISEGEFDIREHIDW